MPAKAARTFALVIVFAGLASCAGTQYVSRWAFEGVDLTDALYLSGETFRLERISPKGFSLFSGRFEVHGEEWRFEINRWKPSDGPQRVFDPPLIYVYRGHMFEKGLAFFSYRVVGNSPLTLFMRVPSDFDIWE